MAAGIQVVFQVIDSNTANVTSDPVTVQVGFFSLLLPESQILLLSFYTRRCRFSPIRGWLANLHV